MKLNLENQVDRDKGQTYFDKLLRLGKEIELKEVKKTRTNLQNRALHLFFTIIAYQLNELGLEFQYQGLSVGTIGTRYTDNIVKEFIWRPIQIALFNKKSTKEIDTKEINEIIDVITKFFGDRGVQIEFPSIETLMNIKN